MTEGEKEWTRLVGKFNQYWKIFELIIFDYDPWRVKRVAEKNAVGWKVGAIIYQK